MIVWYYYSFDGIIWHDHKFNLEYDSYDELITKINEFHKSFDNDLIKKAYWTNASKIRHILKGGY